MRMWSEMGSSEATFRRTGTGVDTVRDFLLRMKLTSGAVICTCAVALALAVRADDRVERLSEVHRTWLEKEVVYVITEREQDTFLSLETEEERNRFIVAFWRQRDPNPATPQNEYRDEHYRRIDYANQFLGRETFLEGWRTDRGRYYIILGEPREIQRFDGYSELVSSELWFYQGDPTLGVPAFFYLLFYKKNGIGEYRLYDPVIDGPQELLTATQYVPGAESTQAVQKLRQMSFELASASLSFDTSEPPDFLTGRPALGTSMMMARIEDSPKRAIRTNYVDGWTRYGNRVSAEYSFNFVPSRTAFSILAEPGGTALVQFDIEIDPENFTLETDENKTTYYTTLDITVEARTADGVLVEGTDKEVFIEFTPSQIREVQSRPFAYQDDFPLVPGDYTVSVILRNRVAKQYTAVERELHIPDFAEGPPALTDVILGFDSRFVGGAFGEGEIRTFQIGELRIYPAADNIFVIGDTVHLVTQAFGSSPEHKVVFELRGNGEIHHSIESSVGTDGVVLDHFSLEGMAGGSYEVVARLVSPSGETLSTKSAPMTVSPRSVAIRPGFVHRRGFNTNLEGELALERGDQLWNLGRFAEAKVELEKAVSRNPLLPEARWMLGNAYLREQRPGEALALLTPLAKAFGNRYEVVAGLGFAFYLQEDYAKAVEHLERARELRPPDTVLLNALGDSFQRVGDLEAARKTFERSLELDPEQPPVKERLAARGNRDNS